MYKILETSPKTIIFRLFKTEPYDSNHLPTVFGESFSSFTCKGSEMEIIPILNSQTSVKCVWNRIGKVQGELITNTVYHVSAKDIDITSNRKIGNLFVDNIFLILLSIQMSFPLFEIKLKSIPIFYLNKMSTTGSLMAINCLNVYLNCICYFF